MGQQRGSNIRPSRHFWSCSTWRRNKKLHCDRGGVNGRKQNCTEADRSRSQSTLKLKSNPLDVCHFSATFFFFKNIYCILLLKDNASIFFSCSPSKVTLFFSSYHTNKDVTWIKRKSILSYCLKLKRLGLYSVLTVIEKACANVTKSIPIIIN